MIPDQDPPSKCLEMMIKSEYSFNLFTLHENELDAKRGVP